MANDFAFAMVCDDGYLPFAAVTAKRLADLSADSAPPLFVLADNAQERNIEMARDYAGERLNIVRVEALLDDLDVAPAGPGRAIFGPLIIDSVGELRDFRRCLLLDVDTMAVTDPTAIASIPHEVSAIAACHDLRNTANDDFHRRLGMAPGSPYFNAGVLWIDLEWVRESGQIAMAKRFLTERREAFKLREQDALNKAFENGWQVLDWRWNVQANLFGQGQIRNGAAIVHFCGVKPWTRPNAFFPIETSQSYLELLAASPWRDRYKQGYTATDRLHWYAGVAGRGLRDRFLQLALPVSGGGRAARFVRRRRLLDNYAEVMQRITSDAARHATANSLTDLIG